MFHLVSLNLQISLNVLPGPCLGLCVGVACFVGFVGFVGLVVGFFLWGNLISITGSFQLLTDHVSHLSGNAGKKKKLEAGRVWVQHSSLSQLKRALSLNPAEVVKETRHLDRRS